jgi:hypothetical protein
MSVCRARPCRGDEGGEGKGPRGGHQKVESQGGRRSTGRSSAVFPRRRVVYDDPSLLRTTQTVRARILMSSHRDHWDAYVMSSSTRAA